MKMLNLVKYNLYQMFSIKKLSITLLILFFLILHKVFQYDFLNKFISVFGTPINGLVSDVLSTILFYFLILIIIKDNFIDNFINKKFLTLSKIKNLNLWIISILLSYAIVIFLYFFISIIITFLINCNFNDLSNAEPLLNDLISRFSVNKIACNLILLNFLIVFIYVLTFICIYTLSKNSILGTIVNLFIMFCSYTLFVKSKTLSLYLSTTQGNIRTYMVSNYSFINSYIIVFSTIIVLLIIIFSSKKSYLL